MKKILLILVVSSFLITACASNENIEKDYKRDAIVITWIDASKGNIKAMETVTFSGVVKEINEKTGTLTVDQDDEDIFLVKNLEEANIQVNDSIRIWGLYAGYNKGFPLIDSKIIERE